jgi:hypothetical protein
MVPWTLSHPTIPLSLQGNFQQLELTEADVWLFHFLGSGDTILVLTMTSLPILVAFLHSLPVSVSAT